MFFHNMNESEIKSFYQTKFFKIMNADECHNGLQYHDGLNVDTMTFQPRGRCNPGGIYFTDALHILEYLNYGNHAREVTFPDDAHIYMDRDKWKADKIILGKRHELNGDFVEVLEFYGLKYIGMNIFHYMVSAANSGAFVLLNQLIRKYQGSYQTLAEMAGHHGEFKILEYLIKEDLIDPYNYDYIIEEAYDGFWGPEVEEYLNKL